MKTSTITPDLKTEKIVRYVLVALFWLLFWEFVYRIVGQDLLWVSPIQVAKRMIALVQELSFWENTAFSLGRIMLGYLLAVVGGTTLAVLTSRFHFLHVLFYPVLTIIKAIPVASFIIIALVWIGRDTVPFLMSFLMVMPMVWANVTQGIKDVDKGHLEVAKVFAFSKKTMMTKVYFPSILPTFLTACVTGLGFAWKSGIAAEVISKPQLAIGTQLYNAKIYIETVDLFAWTTVVILLSFGLEKAIVAFVNKLKVKSGIIYDND